MEPREDMTAEGLVETPNGGRTAGETAAAVVCGAVLGAGILFAAAEMWARGAVEGASGMPLAYVLAGIGALCGIAVVLAFLRSDAGRAASADTDAAIIAEDYVLGSVPLSPMAWHPIPHPVLLAREVGSVEPQTTTSRPDRLRRRPRRRGHGPHPSARRAFHPARAPQQPPAEA